MEYIGLYGKKIENPAYYCRSHNIYLTEEDVKLKKCLCKTTSDMISTRHCKWLEKMDEHKEENLLRSNANYGYRHFKKNIQSISDKSAYKKTVERLLKEQKNG